LIGTLILGVILILILSYYNISIRNVAESPAAQDNFDYIKEQKVSLWENYLKKPVMYFWNNIFIDLLWEPFVANMNRIKEGKPTDFDTAVPTINFGN